jgi:hypothetical protein
MDSSTGSVLTNRLAHEHETIMAAIRAANDDLEARVLSLGLHVAYDRADDTLILTIGPLVEATTESIANTVLVRVDPDTLKCVGLEVLGFKALLRERPPLPASLLAALDWLDRAVTALFRPPTREETAELGRTVKQLIAA